MEHSQGPVIFKILAHDMRWQILTSLSSSDRSVAELIERVQLPQNAVSYHLRYLREAGFISERRSDANWRSLYYSLNTETFKKESQKALGQFHLYPISASSFNQVPFVFPISVSVLFVCTGNSARSQLAEALLRILTDGQIEVRSAGTRPVPLHPLAVEIAAAHGLDLSQHTSKHCDCFAERSFDWVITLCDRAREICPPFAERERAVHWSLPNPAVVQGDQIAQRQAFEDVFSQIRTRLAWLLPTLYTYATEKYT